MHGEGVLRGGREQLASSSGSATRSLGEGEGVLNEYWVSASGCKMMNTFGIVYEILHSLSS